MPHQQGIPFFLQRSQTIPVTSPWSISWTSTLPFRLLLGELTTFSSSSGLPAGSDNNKNSCHCGAFPLEDLPASRRSHSTASLSSSWCAHSSCSACTLASSARHSCSHARSHLPSSSSLSAFSMATWATSSAHRQAFSTSCSASAICTLSASHAVDLL